MGDYVVKTRKDVATLLVNNWYLHDQQKYTDIKKNTVELLIKIGYDSALSHRAGKMIKQIYIMADLAEKCMYDNPAKEDRLYRKMEKICKELDTLLKRKCNSKNELLWWKAIRHKNIIEASYYLFVDQISKFGYYRVDSAFKATIFLFRAGHAHDQKHWNSCRQEVAKLWDLIKHENILRYMEF